MSEQFLGQADVVVVHLGTNDFSNGGRPPEFVDAYVKLLKDIRSRNADTQFILAGGPMLGGDDAEAFREAVERVRQQINRTDAKGATVLEFQIETDEFGCDWHPNAQTHRQMGEMLEALLRDKLGW